MSSPPSPLSPGHQKSPQQLQATSIHAASSSDGDHNEVELNDDDPEDPLPSDEDSRRSNKRQRIHFGVEQLQTVYHLPLKTGQTMSFINSLQKKGRDSDGQDVELCLGCVRMPSTKRGYALFGLTVLSITEHFRSTSSVDFDDRLRRLTEEQDEIIQSAHQPRHPREVANATSSLLHSRPEQEELTVHLRGFQSSNANLQPLDLSRFDSDFPLLFLANVCESVRKYH
ncbi:Hypothetical protein PHPALM_14923 [Phytophthora palmivora]|uniref:Uncharacterized protein n=1 Tax=Phytophthora palmivora TaxID=4796 RepID=A0A2P4XTF7_9STRA|nr:Hypothetical protein PHPALM_14923 [Phytophthora palmivora]